MKTNIWIYGLLLLLLATGCEKESYDLLPDGQTDVTGQGNDNNTDDDQVPEGYFVAKFSPPAPSTTTRAAINGQDSRVQHVLYIVYKSTGEYVKEKVLLSTSGSTLWPLPAVKDTLPNGSYKAIFLGNAEKTLFPYPTESSETNYSDILLDYQTSYSDARITLPPAEFSDNTEYYWANVEFSDTNPNPNVLLQRIIGSVQMQRELINAEDALNMLLANLIGQLDEGDIIQKNVDKLLPNLIDAALNPIFESALGDLNELNRLGVLNIVIGSITSGLDELINPLAKELVTPIVEALNDLLLQELISQLGTALTGNVEKDGLLEYLGVLLNPWNNALAHSVVVSIDDYPKAIDFELNKTDVHEGTQNFKLELIGDITDPRFILLKNFAGSYDVGEINVVGVGLVSGLVVNGLIDNFLLPDALTDISDPLKITDSEANRRYLSSYSLLDLNTKQSVQGSEGSDNLSLSVRLGDIANVDDILGPLLTVLLDPILSLVEGIVGLLDDIPFIGDVVGVVDGLTGGLQENIIDALKELRITIELPINLPLLNINNLTLTGSWSGPDIIND